MTKMANEVTELVLRCAGYGYFKGRPATLQVNFLDYLERCLSIFKKLKTIKLTLNGLALHDGTLFRVIDMIERLPLRTVWIHTNNISNLTVRDFEKVINFIKEQGCILDQNGRKVCKEISVQMMGWEFKESMDCKAMEECFEGFKLEVVERGTTFGFESFRLEMSSWCIGPRYDKDCNPNKKLLK